MLPPTPPQHVPGFNHVNSGLVAVQRVQDYLQRKDFQMHHGANSTSGMQLCGTYMSTRVQGVVGELGVVKGDGSALPVSTCGRRVRVDENTVWKPGLRPADGLPASALETIAGVVRWEDVQEEDVAEGWVQAGQL